MRYHRIADRTKILIKKPISEQQDITLPFSPLPGTEVSVLTVKASVGEVEGELLATMIYEHPLVAQAGDIIKHKNGEAILWRRLAPTR